LSQQRSGDHLFAMEVATGSVQRGEAQLVESAVRSDEHAFRRLIADHHEDMRRVCLYMTRDEAVAEDAVQAAWAIAWRKIGSVREPASVRPWLVSVALNEARQLLRKRRRLVAIDATSPAAAQQGGPDPATGVAVLDLRIALERLSPNDRALIAMRYLCGFESTELGAALHISPAAARQRLKRLIDQLRKELSDG
jgi:RNA polymerase sigma-70 factor (ECF subfamily)